MTESTSWDPTEAAQTEEPGFVGGFFQFLWQNWAWWVTPTVLIFAGLLAVAWFAQDSQVAPFIYALF